ncbi:hypothetical protein NX722_07910 [Endozoicomonas gorgoniicola]|uniref:Conjugal transfer protein TraR n=1 Tax=Endozoicomonas gorgoniicola TaxID=1234144 RepID=A0ABT3MT77_9GAMM|nr:hypothetical protein [Endozoicomonas gorgoniicola]MCW7552574.1 hypothetical protein [Endozoicomonas gorgoniicola]
MDDLDRAKLLEQSEREQLLQQHRQRLREKPLYIEGVACCRDCETSIEERLTAGIDACRCMECQRLKERREKHYAG